MFVKEIRNFLFFCLGCISLQINGESAVVSGSGYDSRIVGRDSCIRSQVTFAGNEDAVLYSKELQESLQGVLCYDFIRYDTVLPPGFVMASPYPQGWSGTFWTRDGGTLLRELVYWGYTDYASMMAQCLMTLVAKNAEGFYSFPQYFDSRNPKSGDELDGTSSIVIGMVLLYTHLPHGNAVRQAIYDFLHQTFSPVAYIQYQLKGKSLLKGEGEFGGGCCINGFYCNVVQNNLSALALLAVADMEAMAGDVRRAEALHTDAGKIFRNMQTYLTDKDGSWIWCIDPETMQPDSSVIYAPVNLGFGGLNGVLSMYADVCGFEPAVTGRLIYAPSCRTFQKLYNTPLRRQQFEKYGIWTQFDVFRAGLVTSPSYGQGYAMQAMLLMDSLTMVSKAVSFMARQTFRPIPEYTFSRKSDYYIYERMYSPEAPGKTEIVEGCGALNLVNVTEHLKVARLMIGIDDSNPDTLKLMPRIPSSWEGFEATHWPVYTRNGLIYATITYCKQGNKTEFHFSSTKRVKTLRIRLPSEKGWKWFYKENARQVDISVP